MIDIPIFERSNFATMTELDYSSAVYSPDLDVSSRHGNSGGVSNGDVQVQLGMFLAASLLASLPSAEVVMNSASDFIDENISHSSSKVSLLHRLENTASTAMRVFRFYFLEDDTEDALLLQEKSNEVRFNLRNPTLSYLLSLTTVLAVVAVSLNPNFDY